MKLKQVVNDFAQQANKSSSGLAQLERQFSKQLGDVKAVIGGSSQRKDAEVMGALQEASKAVRTAAESLQRASRIASQYSQSL